jgi:hypothetical protein
MALQENVAERLQSSDFLNLLCRYLAGPLARKLNISTGRFLFNITGGETWVSS